MNEDNLLIGRDLHKPINCERCGNKVLYKGVGEYECAECGFIMFDDYGKVRNYLETHKGATQGQVAAATGVSTNTIRQLLRDDRLEVAPNSAVFLSCDVCGTPIRSGRFCPACASRRSQLAEQSLRSPSAGKSMRGFGNVSSGAEGARRFSR